MHLRATLTQAIERAFTALGLDGPALVQTAARPEFGDYQANGVMGAAKKAGKNPREVAAAVIEQAELDGIARKVEVAGPGFINITLAPEFVAQTTPGHIEPVQPSATVVVDYSAPNLAKEMHVGHLRGTTIGDCLVRVLQAQGHQVVRQNHVGDWGTQFGMLLTYMQTTGADSDALADLETFYVSAKQRFDEDPDFQNEARQAVVDLQAGDTEALRQWRRFIDISLSHCQEIYTKLGVLLTPDDVMGESAYNEALPGIIQQLAQKDLLVNSDGAQCVFLDEFKNKQGDVLPVIVQKSDGGYLYATTDLAACDYRTGTLNATRVLYFTDARQSLHFRQIFAVAQRAGFNRNGATLEHLPHGSILGKDGKPFKTRDGGVVKLAELLDEAVARATQLVQEKNPQLDDAQAAALGSVIGIGAIKYAELSKNRTTDYVFDWEQMITFEGNTAPYLQYAYTRIVSVFAKGGIDPATLPASAVAAEEPERRLAVTIAGYNDVVEQVAEEGYPHYLCGYLYDLATRFTQFYDQCPILKAASEADKTRRLVLAHQAGTTLRAGLDLLGIGVVEKM